MSNYWTDAEIIDYYDSHWDITMQQLSRITGRSLGYLARLLREEQTYDCHRIRECGLYPELP